MIKSGKGTVEITGTPADVLADVSLLVHHMHHNCFVKEAEIPADESKKLILEAVEKGFKTEDEIKSEVLNLLKNLQDMIMKGVNI